jgi:hypothetical protein
MNSMRTASQRLHDTAGKYAIWLRSTRASLVAMKRPSWLKARIVERPPSDSWNQVKMGLFDTASRRFSSRDVAR